jgi:hypothetical protein
VRKSQKGATASDRFGSSLAAQKLARFVEGSSSSAHPFRPVKGDSNALQGQAFVDWKGLEG